MSEMPPSSETVTIEPSPEAVMPSPWSCLGGSVVAGGIAIALYLMTSTIAQRFAAQGLPTGNMTAQRIGTAVRTLVVGLSALGTGIFALAALGLFGLGLQLLVQHLRGRST